MAADYIQKDKKTSQATRMFIWAVVIIGLVTGLTVFGSSQEEGTYIDAFTPLAILLGILAAGGLATILYQNKGEQDEVLARRQYLNQMVGNYNQRIKGLQQEYKSQRKQAATFFGRSTSSLRQHFSQRYDQLKHQYDQERNGYLSAWYQQHQRFSKIRKLWGWIIVLGLCASVFSCSYSLSSYLATQEKPKQTAWNADNIPIPHLTDGLRYVSNPDSVLSDNSVNIIDRQMRLLDTELGIESTIIIVNHIQNDDPFRMAQDVGNKYGVGRNDRGLMIVVGYEDHSVNISPGKSLEADLTDAECYQLEQLYVVPAMKVHQPDSAMIYLAEGIYAFMQNKEMPDMPEQYEPKSDDSEEEGIFGRYLTLIGLWLFFAIFMESRFEWLGLYGTMALMSNPFVETPVYISSGGSGRGFGGGGFGGGGISGGFGGGSFGGGGATARW